MKHITQLIITAAMLLMTQTAGAQKNIAREFGVFAEATGSVAILSSNVNLDRDMGKNATYLYNEFNVDKDDPQWKQLKKAFDTDAKEAYNVFKKNKGTTDRATSIIRYGSYQKGNTNTITFGSHLDHNYRVLLFRDPADSYWRTCYALVWYESRDDSKKLHGYMYRIYSRDPQMVGKEKQPTTISMLNDGSMIQYDKDTGLSTVVQSGNAAGENGSIKSSIDFLSRFNILRSMYMEKIEQSDNAANLTYCTSVVNNLLSLCKQHAALLDANEKMACRNILSSMQQACTDIGRREMISLAKSYLK